MLSPISNRFSDFVLLLRLSIRIQTGRRFWLVPLLALAWPAFRAVGLLAGWRATDYAEVHAQNALIGFPLTVLAIGLGVRIIASEIEQRTLEVTYSIPGGARRVWIAKLAAAIVLLLITEALLGLITYIFFTPYPLAALYGSFQGAVFYLVAAMGIGALLKSEITGGLVTAGLLGLNGLFTGFGENSSRYSPFFNPLALDDASAGLLLAWTLQNRIGIVLAIIAIAALTFARAERREQLLKV